MLEAVDGSGAFEQQVGAMRSSVAWGLLGLVIERPSYGYELIQRFRRTYGETLSLSAPRQIYTALDALKSRSLIEEVRDRRSEAALARRPRPHYRATEQGIHAYEEWLLVQLEEERRRSRLFVRQLTMLEPDVALQVLDEYEREYLTEAEHAPAADTVREGLAERLLEGEEQTSLEVRLAWIEYARDELKALLTQQSNEGPNGAEGS